MIVLPEQQVSADLTNKMANDLDDIFTSFGCFDDTEPETSLFDNLATLNLPMIPAEEETWLEKEELSLDPCSSTSFAEELMSLGSPTTSEETSLWLSNPDHTYAFNNNNNDNNNDISSLPSPGGSLTSQEESTDLLTYLMNETGVHVTEKAAEEMTKNTNNVVATRNVSKGKKRPLPNDEENDEDTSRTNMDKSHKNAIAARENRLKKKRYVDGLEKQNKTLLSENARLHKTQDKLENKVSSLASEVAYLKSVLFNQSALSGLLKKIGPDAKVRLSSTSFKSREQRSLQPASGGVCLHVNGKDASLEFCSRCSLMSESTAGK